MTTSSVLSFAKRLSAITPGAADALERLLAGPGAARRRALRGRAKVEQDFDVYASGVQMAILFRGPARSAADVSET